jgi:RhoGAP domain
MPIVMLSELDRKRYLHYISIILPKPNRDTMEVLFVFLKWVASFAHVDEETGSKMDLQNLATVICPSILYGKGRDVAHSESVMAIPVVTELLVNQDEFWQVPDEFLPILQDQDYFASSMELPSKEFMKKCDTYMRVRASGRQPQAHGGGGMASPVTHNGAGPPNPQPQMTRSDGPDVRLIPQRSDPSIPRGRPMAPPDPSRPNLNRYIQDSQSLERSMNNAQRPPDQWQQSSPSKSGAPHPGLAHQPYSHSPPPKSSSPPKSATPLRPPLSDADWAASQRPPPNVLGQGSRSGSRPGSGSFVRTSGEISPTMANGRHSPPQGRLQ